MKYPALPYSTRFALILALILIGFTSLTHSLSADTLGLGTVGSSSSALRNLLAASRFTTPLNTGGTVTSMSVYFANAQVSPSNLYQFAIYSDNAGVPGALIAQSAFGTTVSNSWNTLNVSATLNPNTTYWLAVNTNGYNYARHNTAPNGSSRYIVQTFGTMPNNFGASTQSALQLSIYATYTPATGTPVNQPPTISITAPVNAATVSGNVSITTNVTDDVSVSGVQFYLDGEVVGTEDIISPYTYIWNTNLATEGAHTLFAVARDSGSLYATSTSVFVTVDNETDPTDPSGIVLPAEFGQTLIASGLQNPTAMAFAPDGRLFVIEQPGRIRIIKNGVLLSEPFATIPVIFIGEVGLLGIAIDPNFETNRYLYVYYTTNQGTREFNRISRFTASSTNPDVVEEGSETYIIADIGIQAANHDGGVLHFGLDGMLYVGVGEHGVPTNSQNLGNLAGKILRLDVANYPNIIPSSNPFVNQPGVRGEIYAYGVRNPFTFNIDPVDGRININDVGGDQEEINRLIMGANYGWPACTGGPCGNGSYTDPLFSYPKGSLDGCAITGGTFYRGSHFPASFNGKYLFSDYCGNFVRIMEDGGGVPAWGTGFSAPVDLQVAPDGTLYVLEWLAGQIRRVQYLPNGINRVPVAVISSDVQTGGTPLTVNFSAASSTDPDGDTLSYLWDFGDGSETSTSISPKHIFNSSGNFTTTLNVYDNRGGTSTASILISPGNTSPVAEILTPTLETSYQGGGTISFSGLGSDTEDGVLPASAYTWKIDFHHDAHLHPAMGLTSGITNGTFEVPVVGETSTNVWYRLHLTVRDSNNVSHTVTRDIYPVISTTTLVSIPSGLTLMLDGASVVTPHVFNTVVGMQRQIGALASQVLGGEDYNFSSWSDGGLINHAIISSSTLQTYTATYVHSTHEDFGLTIQGSGSSSLRNLLAGTRFITPAYSGNLNSISAYFTNVPAAPNNLYQVAIYSDNNGAPGNLVASSSIRTASPNSWNIAPISGVIASGTPYWLSINANGSTYIAHNTASAGSTMYHYQTFGTIPTPFGAAIAYPVTLSIYGTYTTQ